jgi:hypothetical protein
VWRADLVDASFVPCAPDACCVLNDVVYAYTVRGFCSLTGVQTSLISRGVIDAQFPGRQFEEIRRIHLYANPSTEEIITIIQSTSLNNSSTVYVYSTLYKQWSFFDPVFDRYTAIGTFYPSASGGLPYILFGEYGSTGFAPVVSTWRPDSGDLIEVPELRLQPFYAGDPTLTKQWIDATWVVAQDPDAVLSIQQEVNDGVSSGAAFFGPLSAIDARATLGIVRAGAIAPMLELAAFINTTYVVQPPPTLKGVSVRYLPLTSQQRNR